jgi:hypothetical protein
LPWLNIFLFSIRLQTPLQLELLSSQKTKLTNPKLEKQKMMNFSNVSSCGTSTAYSVPCMFSLLGKDDYSPQEKWINKVS